VVAVSPIVAGAALKGPAASLMADLGHDVSVVGVARIYTAFAGTLVIDEADAGLAAAVEAEGMRAVVHHPVLRTLAAVAFTDAVARGVIGAVILLYFNRELGFGPGAIGLISAVGGASSLLGALSAGRLTRRLGVGPTLILGQLFTGAGSLCLIAATDNSPLAVALLIASQCITDPAATIAEITATSLRQSVAPARVLGRVNASIRFVGLVMTLIFTLVTGLLAGAIGLRGVMAIGVIVNFLPALWLLLSPVRGLRTMAEESTALSPVGAAPSPVWPAPSPVPSPAAAREGGSE